MGPVICEKEISERKLGGGGNGAVYKVIYFLFVNRWTKI
jgi:hypothetical protein